MAGITAPDSVAVRQVTTVQPEEQVTDPPTPIAAPVVPPVAASHAKRATVKAVPVPVPFTGKVRFVMRYSANAEAKMNAT